MQRKEWWNRVQGDKQMSTQPIKGCPPHRQLWRMDDKHYGLLYHFHFSDPTWFLTIRIVLSRWKSLSSMTNPAILGGRMEDEGNYSATIWNYFFPTMTLSVSFSKFTASLYQVTLVLTKLWTSCCKHRLEMGAKRYNKWRQEGQWQHRSGGGWVKRDSVATGMKRNSTGHGSARGFCIPMPWHPLMLNLSLLWGNGDRWQIWPSCLEPGTSMAEATTRCTFSHDFGQEVCFSLLGWWNTACVKKFGEHTSVLHFEVSLRNTCNLCLIPIVSEVEPNM